MNPIVLEYIENNLDNFFQLTSHYREEKEKIIAKNPLFKEEVLNEYYSKIRFIISLEITRDTGCSYEEAILAMEEIGLEKLLG